MIEWTKESEEPEPERRVLLNLDGLHLSLSDDGSNRWQYVSVSFGEFTEESFDDCMETWPAKAIAEMRSKLDSWEAELCTEQESK